MVTEQRQLLPIDPEAIKFLSQKVLNSVPGQAFAIARGEYEGRLFAHSQSGTRDLTTSLEIAKEISESMGRTNIVAVNLDVMGTLRADRLRFEYCHFGIWEECDEEVSQRVKKLMEENK